MLTKVASGTFTLTYNGLTSTAITYSTTPATTASNIFTALTTSPINLATGNVAVTALASSGANNQVFQVTFQGALNGIPQPVMAISTSGLTASANIVLGSVSTTTAGSPALTINTGATLTLDNTTVNNTNRVNDAATVVMNGGTLNYLGGNGVASTETLGTVL